MKSDNQPTDIHDDATGPARDATMRAIVQDSYGSAEVLRPARIARPAIAEHEVLLRVHARGSGSGHLAPDDGPALPDAHHRVRVPQAEEPRCRGSTSPARSSRSVRR